MTAPPLCCVCWGCDIWWWWWWGDAIMDWSSLPSVDGSITSPFLHPPSLGVDFLWCIQQRTPVRAAPMTNDAKATAMAISNGTPTITAWEWCIGGLPFSFNNTDSSLLLLSDLGDFLLLKSLKTFWDRSISDDFVGGFLGGWLVDLGWIVGGLLGGWLMYCWLMLLLGNPGVVWWSL